MSAPQRAGLSPRATGPETGDTPQGADAAERSDPGARALAELRGLLVGGERVRIEALEARPERPSVEDVAALLPDAVRRRVAHDEDLARALASTIESGLERSARANPTALAEAIHPALGPAIRKAIQAALSQALESFNVALENSLSPRGLGWRIEALRTGRPFAEVVLLKSLVYRVEQVFLIHRKTGVLLAEAAHPAIARKDPELVSSMLAAIRDFAVDSFGGDPDADLDRIDLAGLRITLVGSPDAVLAAVVRGTPPERLRAQLEAALETIGAKCSGAFATFRGDSTPFEAQAHVLEDCLGGEQRQTKRSPVIGLIAPSIALALLAWGGTRAWRAYGVSAHHAAVVRALEATPGLVVLGTRERDGVLRIHGLADPAATAPEAVAGAVDAARGLAGIALEFTPYDARGAEFLEARLRARLAPPSGVTLDVGADGHVTLAGSAPGAWITRALAVAPAVAGVLSVDAAGLVDRDRAQLEALVASLGGVTVHFPLGRADLPPGEPVAAELPGRVASVAAAAARAGALVRVRLSPARNALERDTAELALRRAAAVRALMQSAAGPGLLFEVDFVVDGAVPVRDIGGVQLAFEVVSAQAPASGSAVAPGR
ncbi:MAG: hypothetical protein R3F49_15935 [Planctomycetota bacterium]